MANKNKQEASSLTNKEEKVEKTKLKGELTVLESAIAEAKKQDDLIEDRSADIASVERALIKEQSEFVKIKNEFEREIETLQSEVSDLNSQRERRSEEVAGIKDQIVEVTKELDELKTEASQAISTRDGAIAQQIAEVKSLKDQISKLDAERERIVGIVSTRELLENDIEKYNKDIERIKEEHGLAAKRLSTINKNIGGKQAELSALTDEVSSAQSTLEDIIKSTEDKMKAQEADHKKREDVLIERESKCTLREENLKKVSEQLKKAKTELEKKAGVPLNKIRMTLEDEKQ